MMSRLVGGLFLTLAWASAWAPAMGQDVRVPTSPDEIRLSYAPVVKRVAPAVVNVYAARVVENRPMFDDPISRRFFGGGGRHEQVQRSLGSGVIVDPAGLVVTNFHVIENADQVRVSLADKREFEADIVLKDQHSDLAVLRLKDARERFAAIDLGDSDALQVGDVVLAIGNPFGVGQTVTHGIVSAVARTQVGITDYQFFIQTDAAINPGNSGGALVDLVGRLVGINTAIFSRSGGSQGIGFAIPANMVKVVVASAKSGGSIVQRPWLGARLQAVTPEIAEGLGLKRPSGACWAQDQRPHRGDRWAASRGRQCLRLSLRDQTHWRHGAARRRACRQRAGAQRRAGSCARHPPRGARHRLALPISGRQGIEPVAGTCRPAAA